MHVLFLILILGVSLFGEEDDFSRTISEEENMNVKSATLKNHESQDNSDTDFHGLDTDTLEFQINESKESKSLDITISTFEDIDTDKPSN